MPVKKTNPNHLFIRLLSPFLISLFLSVSYSQSGVAINTTGAVANSSAMLDVSSTTGGVLIPRMTSVQRAAIATSASTNGLLVYQTDGTAGFYYYNGTAWTLLASAGNINNITLGQNAITVYGNAQLNRNADQTAFALVPGLTTSVTIPSTGNYYVYVATDGGIQTQSSSASGYSACGIAIEIDGSILSNGGYKKLTALNNGGITGNFSFWSMSISATLSTGTHTIAVYGASSNLPGQSATTIGGDNTSVLQPCLTVILIKQ